MGRNFDKFLLLMWKNWILQIRHPVQTVFEIFVPVLFCAILVVIRSLVTVSELAAFSPPEYDPFAPEILNNKYREIVVSPNGPIVKDIIEGIKINQGLTMTFDYKENSSEIENYLIAANDNSKIGIVFEDWLFNQDKLPKKVEFTIRYPAEINENSFIVVNWETELIYPPIQFAGAREPRREYTASPGYYETGFLTLQTAISREIIRIAKTEVNEISDEIIRMQRYPYPKTTSDPLLEILQLVIGVIIVLSFVYTAISIIKVISVEKETQLKEAMKIMGLPSWIHWLAWFTKSIVFMLISIILMIILFKTDIWYPEGMNAILPKCDITVLFVFMFLYACSIITFCFMISVFFNYANLAAGIGGVGFFFLLVPYTLLQSQYQSLSLSTKLASSLAANSAMGFGFQLLCMFEGTQEGLQWKNLWSTATPDDNLVMGHIFIMLIVDAFIYMLIALYIEAVFPGRYGVPKKWYFIFTWMCKKQKVGQEDYTEEQQLDPECFESEPNTYAGIKIHKIRKVYGKDKVAVRNLSLNMYENQITALLGHNGAGKTTTMSMLTGMYTPTSGTAIINNFDIRTDIDKVRSSLGLCPQHNILFDELTVAEHIKFFSRLKGMANKEIKDEIDHYVKLLRLEDKKDKQSSTLSGGMKRKLSVAVAFCGNSKVVMLDEPTAGMDPAARRALWELVESQKQGRTIMLTTHFMDEADLLGDRIAIMAGGKLQCCGSSFFLKKKYGAGYHLIMDKSSSCNVEAITQLMRAHIPDIEVHSNIGSELTYLLNEKDSACFKEMLQSIESKSNELGIRSYGISLTTLEDVFMRVGADHGQEEMNNLEEAKLKNEGGNNLEEGIQRNGENYEYTKSTEILITSDNDDIKLTGFQLQMNHIKAMFMKRFLSTIRSYGITLVQIVMPIFMLTISIYAARTVATEDLINLPITLNSYNKPVVAFQTNNEQNKYFLAGKTWVQEQEKKIHLMENLPETIIALTEEDPSNVRLHYQIGVVYSDKKLTGYFNNDPFHTPPLILNFMMNSVLKSVDPEREIIVNNYPLPFRIESKLQLLQQGNNMGFQMAMNIGFCMAFISAFYTLFYIRERVCKAKHLQIVSGANIVIFWVVNYIWDWILFVITVIVLLLTLICFQEDGFKTWEDISHMIVIFAYFCFAMLPMVYLCSLLFDTPVSGFTRIVLVAVLLGNFGFVVIEILYFNEFNLTHVAKPLDWIFLIIPHYSLAAGIRNVNVEFSQFQICKQIKDKIPELFCLQTNIPNKICCERDEAYYAWEKPGILRNIVVSIVIGILGIIVLFMKEYKIFSEISYLLKKKPTNSPVDENVDEDVAEEAKKIKHLSMDQIKDQSLVLLNVSKRYKKFRAVNNLHLGVNTNECFGLLGVNGAGKTTTFKMITGDIRITEGDVYVKGLNLKKDMAEVNKLIGYCPQFDALLDDLTGKETIKLFALLRGYTEPFISQLAEKLANDFDFKRHINKKVKEMSGGNKRKLSTAVALIGDPPILYLDEPTTGMDPGAKRFLWNALCKIRDSGKCLILTSHSMEECEALCTRLAIMVNGSFKCLGSTQHLKNKFSQGYTLTVKLGKSQGETPVSSETIENHVVTSFPSAILREKHQELITFYISDTSVTWSSMFGVMEDAKDKYNIEDYSLGQSTLEQVFLTFTNKQMAV